MVRLIFWLLFIAFIVCIVILTFGKMFIMFD